MMDDKPQGEKDSTEGLGQPVSEGEKTAGAQPVDGGDAAKPAAAASSAQLASTTGLEANQDPSKDDVISKQLLPIARQAAKAEAMKPVAIAVEELYSEDPAKAKARDAIIDAYKKARGTATAAGELTAKYAIADEKFTRAATDMRATLTDWIARQITAPDGKVRRLIDERQQVGDRLEKRSGERELARLKAQAETKRWADRYADWTAPHTKMLARIGEYIDKIDKLNADINNEVNSDQAIFIFWFEVAPKHLGLRPDEVTKNNAPGFDALFEALPADLGKRLQSGVTKKDGSLYLIDPTLLEQHRKDIVTGWTEAATAQAAAEARYKLAPDDAAALKARFDKLRDDGWIAGAKTLLDAPAT